MSVLFLSVVAIEVLSGHTPNILHTFRGSFPIERR